MLIARGLDLVGFGVGLLHVLRTRARSDKRSTENTAFLCSEVDSIMVK